MSSDLIKIITLFALLTTTLVTGCAGTAKRLGSAANINQLTPGMSKKQVISILGNPWEKGIGFDKQVWKYSLHQFGKGWSLYFLVFDGEDEKLKRWYNNEKAFRDEEALLPNTTPVPAHLHQHFPLPQVITW